MLIALSAGWRGLAFATLGVVVFMNVVENVLEPTLLGSSLDLLPIVVLLVTVAGGAHVGLVLAAPFRAIGINLFQELRMSGFFDDDAADSGPNEPRG